MSQQYDNTNTGAIFKNDRKTEERQPDYTGKIDVEGREYKLAGWIAVPKNGGAKFIRVKLTAPEEQGVRNAVERPDNEDREVPF